MFELRMQTLQLPLTTHAAETPWSVHHVRSTGAPYLRVVLAVGVLMMLGGCSGSSNDTEPAIGGTAGSLALRALWEQPNGSSDSKLPAVVRTVRIVVREQVGSSAERQCCLAVDPRNLPINSQSGGRSLIVDSIQRGTAVVTLDGFAGLLVPSASPSDTRCATVPAGVGDACDPTHPAAPAYSSAMTPVDILPGSISTAPDIAVQARPFVLDATPALDSSTVSPFSFTYVIADAVHSIDAASIALDVSDPNPRPLSFVATACDDRSPTPCSANGTLGLSGFRVTTSPQAIAAGSAEARVRAAATSPAVPALDLRYPFNAIAPTSTATNTPTQTPTRTATATLTPSATPTSTATATATPSVTATATPTATPTQTSTATQTPTSSSTPTSTNTARPAREVVFVVNSGADSVSVIEPTATSPSTRIATGSLPLGIAVRADGRRAFVTNSTMNSVSVIDTKGFAVIQSISVGSNPSAIVAAPDTDTIYVVNSGDDTLSVINSATFEVISVLSTGKRPLDVAVSPSGDLILVAAADDSRVDVWNGRSLVAEPPIAAGPQPTHLVFAPDGVTAYVSTTGDTSITEIDIPRRIVRGNIQLGNIPGEINISRDGTQAWVLTPSEGSIAVVDLVRRERVATIAGFTRPSSAALSLDGSHLYVSNRPIGTVAVLNTRDGAIRSVITVESSPTKVLTHLIPRD